MPASGMKMGFAYDEELRVIPAVLFWTISVIDRSPTVTGARRSAAAEIRSDACIWNEDGVCVRRGTESNSRGLVLDDFRHRSFPHRDRRATIRCCGDPI